MTNTDTQPNAARVFVVEEIKDSDKVALLSRHGTILALTSTACKPKPPLWNTYAMSEWIQEALAKAGGFDYDIDYLALAGNYLALSQLTATLVAYSRAPYAIRCLAHSRRNDVDEFCHVVLEECVSNTHCNEEPDL